MTPALLLSSFHFFLLASWRYHTIHGSVSNHRNGRPERSSDDILMFGKAALAAQWQVIFLLCHSVLQRQNLAPPPVSPPPRPTWSSHQQKPRRDMNVVFWRFVSSQIQRSSVLLWMFSVFDLTWGFFLAAFVAFYFTHWINYSFRSDWHLFLMKAESGSSQLCGSEQSFWTICCTK